MQIYSSSITQHNGVKYYLAQDGASARRYLCVEGDAAAFQGEMDAGVYRCSLTSQNAAALRARLSWLKPQPLGLDTTFGFGDRLGIATPGHIAALADLAPNSRVENSWVLKAAAVRIAPVFAQQSVRENARTGRTPQQVVDEAMWVLFADGWRHPWGADADHLKSPQDIAPFIDAGYSFFTVDPGEYVDNAADHDTLEILQQKADALHGLGWNWNELLAVYLSPANHDSAWGKFTTQSLLRALVKYGRAVRHTAEMYQRIWQLKNGAEFDFEASVDETDTPTTPLEHYFIANELTRLGVRFTSLAPRFIGRFEKGVDYIGDLAALDAEMAKHAAVTASFGSYKISLHSGSDKFSVYPLIARHWGARVHVKTAGTSYLEALRVLARLETALFSEIWTFSKEHYETDRRTYHVSARLDMLPAEISPALLDDFHARQVLHVTFGSVMAQFGVRLMKSLEIHNAAYCEGLKVHFLKHLRPFQEG